MLEHQFLSFRHRFIAILGLGLFFVPLQLMANECANLHKRLDPLLTHPESKPAHQWLASWETHGCHQAHNNDPELIKKIAGLLEHVNDYREAERWYEEYLLLIKTQKGEMNLSYVDVLDKLGHLYLETGAEKHAEKNFRKALEIRQKLLGESHSETAHSINNLAGVYYQRGDTETAGKLFKQAAEIWRSHHGEEHHHYATAINNQAWNHLESGDHHKAVELFEHSLEQRTKLHGTEGHHDIANSLTGLAHAYHLTGATEKAEPLLRKALPLLHHDKHTDMLWQVQHHFSQNLASQGHTGAAIFLAKHALENLHSRRVKVGKVEKDSHKAFLADKDRLYAEMIELLMQQGRVNESHHVIEMLREEEFFDFIHRDKHSGVAHTIEPVYAPHEEEWERRYQQINQRMAALNRTRGMLKQYKTSDSESQKKEKLQQIDTDLDSVHKQLDDFLDDLKTEFPEHKGLEEEDLAHLRALQTELKNAGNGTVALHYLVGEQRIHIILTTPEQQISRDVDVNRAELSKKVRAFRSATQNLTKPPLQEAQALYQILVEPIAQDLSDFNTHTLMLTTDGALRYIPFSALHDGKQYLIERYAVVLHNQVVDGLGKHSAGKPWHFTGLGLSQKVEGFHPLPSVKDELDEMRKLMSGDIHLNDAFDRQALHRALAEKRPLVHIASHFVLQPGTERDSYLVLGNGEPLSLAELRADYDFSEIQLLTLSACNTAMGVKTKGSEIEGLASLARHKGAHSVFASLWYINDEGTGQFMQHFYRLRHDKKLNKALTLQQVQIAFIKGEDELVQFRHPFFWAPFVLMGDWL